MMFPDDMSEEYIYEVQWGEWYEDKDGFLYIITNDELYGPDNEMYDAIIKALHRGVVPERLDGALPLTHVGYILRRHSQEDGFYQQ